MPTIEEIKNKKSKFKKREYRPYNPDGAELNKANAEKIQETKGNNHSNKKENEKPVVNKNPEPEIKQEPLKEPSKQEAKANLDNSDASTTAKPNTHHNAEQTILEIETNLIKRWAYKDRPDNELGDIQGLAEEFKTVGQQLPCIVRPVEQSKDGFKYELIAGERRWRAAQQAKLPLKVLVRSLSDSEAALSQAAENNNRKDLSDYAKGMSFAKLIENGVLQQKDLIEKLGKSKQYVSALLSFAKIDTDIVIAIEDLSLISAKTAEAIVRLQKKGDEYVTALINLAPRLKTGTIGWRKVDELVSKSLFKKDLIENTSRKVITKSGRHVFTWRTDNNALPSIHFPKQINDLFEKEKIDINDLSEDFLSVIEQKLEEL